MPEDNDTDCQTEQQSGGRTAYVCAFVSPVQFVTRKIDTGWQRQADTCRNRE
jgi:hypothetical protein